MLPFPPRYFDPAYWRTAFIASDPDLARWRMAARVTLSVFGSAALMWLVSSLLHVPLPVMLPGVMLTMTAAITVNDPTPKAQRLTMALLPLSGALCLTLGTLLAPYRDLDLAIFLLIIFGAVYIRRFGPRGTSLGMIGYLSYFFALFFQAPLNGLPMMILSIVLGVAFTYVVRFQLITEDPARLLRRSVRAFRMALGLELSTLADALSCPQWGRAQDLALDRAVRRLNRLALTVEDYVEKAPSVEPGPAALRRKLFELEIAAERLAATLRYAAGHGLSAATRDEVAQALQAVRLWLYHREVPPPRLVPATPESALSIHALQDLVTAAQSLGEPTPAPLPLVQAPAPSGAPQRPAGLNPATRQAIQATLATGLSMAAGLLVAPTRWYWAVIGAYIMFIRATTLGETLVRGWQRILGTALGVLAGVVLAHLMRGHPVVEVVEMALACFLGFYFMGYSYLWMVVGITLLLAAFYLLLGRYSPELLVMRLELTLVGCVIGGIVAALVLPVPTNVKVRTTLIAVLRDLADLVEQSLEHRSAPDAVEHARPLDRKLQDLHEAAKPLTGRFLPLSSQGLHRALHYLAAGATFARHLVITSERLPESHPDVLLPIGCHVVDNIRAIAEDLSERKAIRHLEDAAACTEPLESALEQCPVPVREAVYWLEQLDEAIVGVGRTLDARLR